jgi:hypothetical protein
MQNEKLEPSWLLTIRLLGSGILLLLWALMKKIPIWDIWKDKKDSFGIIALVIFGFLGVQYTYFIAIQTGNAVTTSLLHFLGPAFVLIYFSFRKRTLPTKYEWVALILASIGTFLLVTNGSINQLTVPFVFMVWGVVSAIAGAFYLIQPVQSIKKWGSVLIVGWGMIIGGLLPPGKFLTYTQLSKLQIKQGKWSEAQDMAEQAVAIGRETGDLIRLVAALNTLGDCMFLLKEYDQATAYYQEALALSKQQADQKNVHDTLRNLARCLKKTDKTAYTKHIEEYFEVDLLLHGEEVFE